MHSYTSETIRKFATASYMAGVFDENLLRQTGVPAYEAWASRRDAQAVAEMSGKKIDMHEVIRGAGEDFATNLQQPEHETLNLMRARRLLWTSSSGLSADLIAEVHRISIKHTIKELDPDEIARFPDLAAKASAKSAALAEEIKDDAERLASRLTESAEAADLYDMLATLFECTPDTSFKGRGPQLRGLLASWIAARLLGLRHGSISASGPFRQEFAIDDRPDAARFARAIEAAMRLSSDALKNINILRKALIEECRPDRANSRMDEVVDFFMIQPIASARMLQKALRISRKGAFIFIERMLSRGVLEDVEPDRAKNRVFKCVRAMTI